MIKKGKIGKIKTKLSKTIDDMGNISKIGKKHKN